MRRRNFLQGVGAAASSALATGSALSAPSPLTQNGQSREPKVFFYDDGRHCSALYQFAPPLIPDDLSFAVDQLVNSGVDTLLYSAGLEGGIVQYDSRVAQKWGDNVELWTHEIFYRASRNLHQLIADGHDPMKFLCDRCHQKGMRFIPTAPVCILGGDRANDGGLGRKSDFVYENPSFYVGRESDSRTKLLGRFFRAHRLNFLQPEVRRERFLIFEELLSRYDTDGIELDLSIDNEFGPFCRFHEIDRLAPVLTRWIGHLREAARKAEEVQGRRKRIYVRIPSGGQSFWKIAGFEVSTWVSEKLVDGLICLSPYKKETPDSPVVFFDQDLDLSTAIEQTRGTQCRVLAGLTTYLGRQLESSATAPMIWAAASLAYDQGADGFGLCNGAWTPNGWPWGSDQYQTLRLLGHPELLARADKVYRVRSLKRSSGNPRGLFPIDGPLLPHAVPEGKSLEVPLRIVDDLPHWQALGRVESVRLRVRLTNFEPSLNQVEVQMNGRLLPDSLRREIDLHFRVLKNFAVNPYGYILEYLLTPAFHPKRGINRIKVALLRRDPKLNLPMEVYDVDCSIQYRTHRSFEQNPIEY